MSDQPRKCTWSSLERLGRCDGVFVNDICTKCKRHPYRHSITVQNGGTVRKCSECKQLTSVRWVTEVTYLGGDSRDEYTYHLCDRCTDIEVGQFREAGAKLLDGRRPIAG